MKRFGRWLFNGLAVLSLLLCMETIAIWVGSYRAPQDGGIGIGGGDGNWGAYHYRYYYSSYGAMGWGESESRIHFSHDRRDVYHDPRTTDSVDAAQQQIDHEIEMEPGRLAAYFHFAFRVGRIEHLGSYVKFRYIQTPWWFLVLLEAILPACWTRTRNSAGRRRNYESRNTCGKCGYDLRATPDRCPECGTIPPKKGTDFILNNP
jgi:hypothetical protein